MSASLAELGSLAKFINGAAFKPEDWSGQGKRIIRIQNLTDGSKPFNRTSREVSKQLHVHPGDLLVSWSASLGVFEWPGPDVAVLNQHIFRVVPDERRVDKRYLRYGLDRALREMHRHLHGATMQHVNRGEFLSTQLYVPSLPEQRRIAEILDKADALRAKRRAALAQLDTLTQSIFLDMFGGAETILKSWPLKRLGELLDFLTSGSRGWAGHYSAIGALFLRIQNVGQDELLLDDVAFVQAPDTAEAKRTRVQSGDVLLSITADLGRTGVVPDDLGSAYINQHLAILRSGAVEPRFLSAYLSSPVGLDQILRRNRQGVKAGLNFDDIRSFIVPLPPLELQRSFASRVHWVMAMKVAMKRAAASADDLFGSLQMRAFKGTL